MCGGHSADLADETPNAHVFNSTIKSMDLRSFHPSIDPFVSISSHGEGFSAPALPLRIGVFEREFTGELGFFPVHDGSHDVEECHGLDEHLDPIGLHLDVLFRFLEGVVERVRKAVASSSLDSQPDSECSPGVLSLQYLLYSIGGSFRQDYRVFSFQASSSRRFFFEGGGTGRQQPPAFQSASGAKPPNRHRGNVSLSTGCRCCCCSCKP